MLQDKDADRLNDRQIAHNTAHGFGAAMLAIVHPKLCVRLSELTSLRDTSANTILGFIKVGLSINFTTKYAHS
jgi:hypothetical protein